jgi:Flp pilus assembly protein CpaB
MEGRAGAVRLNQIMGRRRLNPPRWRLVIAAAIVVLISVTWTTVRNAESARSAWVDQLTVATAARDLAAGEVIGDDDVRDLSLPRAAVPRSATPLSAGELVGQRVRAAIMEGEAVVTDRVGDAGLSPLAAKVEPTHRAVAVPLGEARPPLQAGDRVDLVAAGTSRATGERTVARLAEVLDVAEQAVTVAIPVGQVPDVVAAAVDGIVVPVLAGN